MIIDVNTAVGRWPFSEAQSLTPPQLSSLLARAGVDLALTSSLEAVFHEDPDEDNRRLFRQLRGYERLFPVPIINARLAGATGLGCLRPVQSLRIGLRRPRPMPPAVKILPSYHSYSLAGANVAALAAELAERRLPLLVQMRMEDERVQSPAFRVPPVPVDEVVALARRNPGLSIVALGTYVAEAVTLLRQTPQVRVEVSFLDGLDVVGTLVRKNRAYARRLLLGSHSPLFYAQSAVLKVQTAEITAAVRQAILGENARKMLGL